MTFYSNIPTVLAQQDFNDKHADMLAAAREGVNNLVYDPMFDEMVSKEEFKRRRDESVQLWAKSPWIDLLKSDAKVGSVVRIRLPKYFTVVDTNIS